MLVDQARERLQNVQEAATRPEILSSKLLTSAEPKTARQTPVELARVEARDRKDEPPPPTLTVASSSTGSKAAGRTAVIPVGSRSQWIGRLVKVDEVLRSKT